MNNRVSVEKPARTLAHALLVIVLAFVLGIGLGIPVMLGMALLGYSLSPPSTAVLAATSIAQYVGFIAVVGAYLRITDVANLVRVRIPDIRDIAWMVAGLFGLFVAVYLVGIVITALGTDQAQNTVITMGQQNPELFLLMIPITILFVAPGEELVFRGVVQGRFRRSYGAVPAIVIASVLFGVVHYVALAGTGKLTYIVVAILLGLILGSLYERTDNILVPIFVHGIYNAILFAGQWAIAVNDVPIPT
ncbi:MAG: CPBP family intramembrane glutamic endopeptidase [archaeon]